MVPSGGLIESLSATVLQLVHAALALSVDYGCYYTNTKTTTVGLELTHMGWGPHERK